MISKKYGLAVWGLALTLVTGCSGEPEQAGGGFQRPPTPVEAAPVTTGPVTDRFSTVGTLEAENSIIVTGEIDGIVVEVPFREGRRLAAGELIARLDDDQLKAETLADMFTDHLRLRRGAARFGDGFKNERQVPDRDLLCQEQP